MTGPIDAVHAEAIDGLIEEGARRRRIVFMVTHSNAGGAQEIWSNLAEGFHTRGDPVTLAALYPSEESCLKTPEELPWTHMTTRRPRSPFEFIKLMTNLISFLKREQPDAVITALPAANILAPIAVLMARAPTRVITSHHSPSETYTPLLNWIDGLMGALPPVAHIVAVSNTVARSHSQKPAVYRAKLKTILNALPPRIEAEIAALAHKRGKRKTGRKTIVAAGRLVPQKNYPTLIRAAAHMDSGVTIKILGAGPDEIALKALAAELNVLDRVEFAGFYPRDQALDMLSSGDVFVQPSLFEGHSLALIEAAQMGLPIVVSDAPVQIEGVSSADGTRCGVVVGLMDHQALAQALQTILNDPSRYRQYAALAAKLGAEATYARMFAAYSDLLV